MANYKIVTRLTDTGPYITKIILELPVIVGSNDIDVDTFNVYTERKELNGEILMRKEKGESKAFPSVGYRKVCNTYPCDSMGNKIFKSNYVALQFDEERLGKRIEGNVLSSCYLINEYRITQTKPLPADDHNVCGLVFDTCVDDICNELKGWKNSVSSHQTMPLKYGYFTPENINEKIPMLIWLHGAGEGGDNPLVAYTGNRVTAFSSFDIQRKLCGKAYVLAPQSPTVWMDNGEEKLGKSNKSIYVEPLKYLIDEFIAQHQDTIDTSRIYITGISNGGFMTMRMLLDYPNFFAAAAPGCTPYYVANIDNDDIQSLIHTPIWFVHAKKDELVDPYETTVPLYKMLRNLGHDNLHFTFLDEVVDPTGQYKDELGRPLKIFNHGVWVPMLDDVIKQDYNGLAVIEGEEPCTLWDWMGKQQLGTTRNEKKAPLSNRIPPMTK